MHEEGQNTEHVETKIIKTRDEQGCSRSLKDSTGKFRLESRGQGNYDFYSSEEEVRNRMVLVP